MTEESFLLVNLKESESKKLAQVISNDTSRKILDFLSKKSATETEIAKELKVPLSTIHYNLQHLAKAKLVNADEFHYSEKGKEVIHYSLSNKYIIIAPKPSPKFLDSLKKIIPAVLIVGVAAGAMKLFTIFNRPTFEAAKDGARMLAAPAADMMEETVMAGSVQEAVIAEAQVAQPLITNTSILTFVYGALFAIAVYFIVELFWRKLK